MRAMKGRADKRDAARTSRTAPGGHWLIVFCRWKSYELALFWRRRLTADADTNIRRWFKRFVIISASIGHSMIQSTCLCSFQKQFIVLLRLDIQKPNLPLRMFTVLRVD